MTARADAPQRLRAKAKAAPQAVSAPVPVVPPRQIDVMHAPTYQPKTTQVCRPGALDAARLPSRGVRC